MMKNLRVDILRGECAIGENLIEITDGNSKILLEYGEQLYPTEKGKEVAKRVKSTFYDAIFITHCHADHSGLLKDGANTYTVYMGEATHKILSYCNGINVELQNKIKYFQSGKALKIGEIKVTPYLCDHSAYDSYMLLIEKEGERILYTGDFRSNGRKNFSAFLNRLPEKVDVLITEGTNWDRPFAPFDEAELEKRASSIFKDRKRIFILQSVLNVDRTVTMYKAAKKAGRPYIQLLSSAEICALLKNIPEPIKFKDCYTYLSKGVDAERHMEIIDKFGKKLLSMDRIAELDGTVMQVSGNSLNYLKKLNGHCNLEGSLLVYSMWEGYKPKMKVFLEGVADMGIEIVGLHTSGHADKETVDALWRRVNPRHTIFVHREKNN